MMLAKVLEAKSPSFFTAVLGTAEELKNFDDYHKKLEDFARKSVRITNKFEGNNPVIAKCSVLGRRWMKGIIHGSFSSTESEVAFQNYDVVEIAFNSDIVSCPDHLQQLDIPKAKIVDCCLKGLDSNGSQHLPAKDVTYFRKQVMCQTLKVVSIEKRKTLTSVDLAVKLNGNEEKNLRELMMLKENHRTADCSDGDKKYTKVEKRTKKHDRTLDIGRSRDDEDDSTVEEICSLMKITKEEYLSIRDCNDRKDDVEGELPISELISAAMSAQANHKPGMNHKKAQFSFRGRGRIGGRANRSYEQTLATNCLPDTAVHHQHGSGIGRTESKRITRYNPCDENFVTKERENASAITDEGLSRDKDFPPANRREESLEDALKRILSEESTSFEDTLLSVLTRIGIENKMEISAEDEEKVSICLQLLAECYVNSNAHTLLCIEFINQIIAKSKEIHFIWASVFWEVYDTTVERLEGRSLLNLSSFMADTIISSQFWLDGYVRDTIDRDIITALEKILLMVEKSPEASLKHNMLMEAMTNFLAKISEEVRDTKVGREIRSIFSQSRTSSKVKDLLLSHLTTNKHELPGNGTASNSTNKPQKWSVASNLGPRNSRGSKVMTERNHKSAIPPYGARQTKTKVDDRGAPGRKISLIPSELSKLWPNPTEECENASFSVAVQKTKSYRRSK